MIRHVLMLLAVFTLVSAGNAQTLGEEVLRRVEAGLSGIRDYHVDLDVTADMERLNAPPMRVHMFFKQPDKVHFESENFALLPHEGLAFSVSRLRSRFTVEGTSEEDTDGVKQYKLRLRPRDERTRILGLEVYIDSATWKPARIVSVLMDGRTMSAVFQYEAQGGYIMPTLLAIRFTGSTNSTESSSDDIGPGRPLMPRTGLLTIRYSNYHINTGLADDVFDKK